MVDPKHESKPGPLVELFRLIAVAFGCLAVFCGTVLTAYGAYALIQVFATDDPKARDIFKGCAPLLLISGIAALLMGVMVVRRFKLPPLRKRE